MICANWTLVKVFVIINERNQQANNGHGKLHLRSCTCECSCNSQSFKPQVLSCPGVGIYLVPSAREFGNILIYSAFWASYLQITMSPPPKAATSELGSCSYQQQQFRN